jgi:hypothetical protein
MRAKELGFNQIHRLPWRLKSRLHKQNPADWVKKVVLVHGGGLRMCSRGFNRRI